ncbi:ERAD-associated protein [Coemansia erecta]|uniref:ERAD-associated protein n=1 Tax=Coemansia asiatica TaxID=1052880 RepID=A0A9W7XQU1_9FUNG|nr:ERAD-associated protein [Coemansia asiatica]KAJ2858036.1 ERAD-associated protein [Coemansia erecta]KAJ2880558.1 ERAD-associated protein [Coemansia asiatica]
MRLSAGFLLWAATASSIVRAESETTISRASTTDLVVPTTDASVVSEAYNNKVDRGFNYLDDQIKKNARRKAQAAEFEEIFSILQEYQSRVDKKNEQLLLQQKGAESMLKIRRDISQDMPELLRAPFQTVQQLISRVVKWGPHRGNAQMTAGQRKKPKELQAAVQKLERLADNGFEEAMVLRAQMKMYGQYSFPMDLKAAFAEYQQISETTGNAEAQYMLGFFYSTGIGGVPQKNSLALLYTSMAAMQGHIAAAMAMGFRMKMGLGVPADCTEALGYYQLVARTAIDHYLSGPPLGRTMPEYRIRLSDETQGVYGVKTGPYSLHRATGREDFDELVEYYRFSAQKGNLKAGLALADLYYSGHQHKPRNYTIAARHVRHVLSQIFTADGKLQADLTQAEVNVAGHAAGLYGIMLLRGEGVEEDTRLAAKWLEIGTKLGHGAATNALGYMYRHGIEVAASDEDAIELFKKAAEKNHSGGQVNYAMAVMLTMPKSAMSSLNRAARNGNVLAHYTLGQMYAPGVKQPDIKCHLAVASFCFVAENADWLHSPFPEAAAAFRRGDLAASALHYLRAAEMGYSVGQLNAAMLLEHAARVTNDSQQPSAAALYQTQEMLDRHAMVYWTRAANQNIPDARIKQGDHFYYGRGAERNPTKAAAAYRIAADAEKNGLAMWNLGYMFENGIGVARDFHLAKRYYDSSLEVNDSGRLAACASLVRLCAKYLWAWARGEDVGDAPLFFAPRLVTKAKEATGTGNGNSNGAYRAADMQNDNDNDDDDDNNDSGSGSGRDTVEDQNKNANHKPQQHLLPANQHGDVGFQPDEWDLGGDALDGEADSDELGSEEETTVGESVFFVVLFLAAAWMFLPLR